MPLDAFLLALVYFCSRIHNFCLPVASWIYWTGIVTPKIGSKRPAKYHATHGKLWSKKINPLNVWKKLCPPSPFCWPLSGRHKKSSQQWTQVLFWCLRCFRVISSTPLVSIAVVWTFLEFISSECDKVLPQNWRQFSDFLWKGFWFLYCLGWCSKLQKERGDLHIENAYSLTTSFTERKKIAL